jgi:hypothetical protein
MTAISGLSAKKLGAFRARAIAQFQVTMRRRAMFLSLADGSAIDFATGARSDWRQEHRPVIREPCHCSPSAFSEVPGRQRIQVKTGRLSR